MTSLRSSAGGALERSEGGAQPHIPAEAHEFETLRQAQFLATVLPGEPKELALADAPSSGGSSSSESDAVRSASCIEIDSKHAGCASVSPSA